jgi:hypothetical protein
MVSTEHSLGHLYLGLRATARMFPPHLIWVWHQSLVMKTKMVLTRLHNNNRCRRNKSFKNDFFYNFGFKIDENNRLNCHLDEPQGRFVNFNQNKFRTNFNRRSLDALLLIQIQKKTEQKIDFCWLVKPAKALPTSRLRSNWTWLRRKSAVPDIGTLPLQIKAPIW